MPTSLLPRPPPPFLSGLEMSKALLVLLKHSMAEIHFQPMGFVGGGGGGGFLLFFFLRKESMLCFVLSCFVFLRQGRMKLAQAELNSLCS